MGRKKNKKESTNDIIVKNIHEPQILKEDIADIFQKSYIEYAMEVITDRALPDVKDGLKPVHRRILYGMSELNLYYKGATRKSARIVGDVLGKYHPHGDKSVYDAMVRMAQTFSLRYPLVTKQGNFGSIDGDSPAAMRYTEAKLSPIGEEMLKDIRENTVEFIDNFDGTMKEPILLPSKVPNLLINGSMGIAVGMATSIPPHNLKEVIDAIIATIQNPNITINEIVKNYIKGPDFPLGAYIVNNEEILKAYETGKGKLTLKGKISIEDSGNRPEIIIKEIPFGISKPNLLEKIALLIREGKIDGISDVKDESNKSGIRIVIRLKKGTSPKKIVHELYKNTDLQTSFSVILLALKNGVPYTMNLKEIITYYIEHQVIVFTRKLESILFKLEKKEEILLGLIKAGENIDKVISIIRQSKTKLSAKKELKDTFNLTEIQIGAILSMPLEKISNIEIKKTKKELNEIQREIKSVKKKLKNIDKEIIESLIDIKEKYGDERRTTILSEVENLNFDNHILPSSVVVCISKYGYIFSVEESLYKRQVRGGKGLNFFDLAKEDYIVHSIPCKTENTLGLFTTEGLLYKLLVKNIPLANKSSRGTLMHNLIDTSTDSEITAHTILDLSEKDKALTFLTKMGTIKKTLLNEISNSKNGTLVIKLKENDKLINVYQTEVNDEIILITRNNKTIRFNSNDVRPMGRVASGVIAIKLEENDFVVSAELSKKGEYLLVISEMGYGKKTLLEEYKIQNRGGKGMLVANFTGKKGNTASGLVISTGEDILFITNKGKIIRMNSDEIATMSRNTSGGKILDIEKGDFISSATVLKTDKSFE